MPVSPESWAQDRLRIHQLIDLVTSRSTRVPPALRVAAAYALLEARQTLDDYLQLVALREFHDGDGPT